MVNDMFGAALRRLRVEAGISLRQLAVRLNYSPAYLSEIERGVKRVTADFAARCDDELGAGGYLVAVADASHDGPRDELGGTPLSFGAERLIAQEVIMAAAHESTARAADDGSRAVADVSIEQVRADVEQLAREYDTVSPLQSLVGARRTRDLAAVLAERTRKPTQTSQLYLTVGQACGLMASASFDLAIWPAAMEQARAAYVYGELVEHRSLQSWARGFQALIAYWCDRPREATNLAEHGLELAPAGTARTRLLSIAARAWSQLGDADMTAQMVHAAERERDSIGAEGTDDLHDRVGGEFGWSPARQAMSAATSYLTTGRAQESAEQARHAMQLGAMDAPGAIAESNAATDLASAELLAENLDAVDEALQRIWAVPSDQRRHALVGRLNNLAAGLTREPFHQVQQARDLRDRIETFVADSAPRALPPGTSV